MSFVSPIFLCVFLPLVVLLHRLLPTRFRNVFLLVCSLVFYAWGSRRDFLILLFSIAFTYFAAIELQSQRDAGDRKKVYGCAAIDTAILVGVLAVYKYSALTLPAGISFFTFSELSCLFDIVMGREDAEEDLIDFALYVALFPKVLMGPIVQYKDLRPQLKERNVTAAGLESGVMRFLKGLFKKILLADAFGAAFAQIQAQSQLAGMTAVLGTIFFGLQLYFDFSGYSDMAIGTASMLGFRLPKNFDYPYTSHSATEFWRRWHITLGAWFRDYVYIPLGGSRVGNVRLLINLLIVWLLTGIWHGSTANFILWGLYWGAVVIIEKFFTKDFMAGLPKAVSCIIMNVIAFVGWTFFFTGGLSGWATWWGKIFGADGLGFWNAGTSWYFFGNLFLLIVGILACSPLLGKLFRAGLRKCGKGGLIVGAIVVTLLIVLSFARILSSTYQTFLYAAF